MTLLKFASAVTSTKPAPLLTYHCHVTDDPVASADIEAFPPRHIVESDGLTVISALVFTVNVASAEVTLVLQPVTTTWNLYPFIVLTLWKI